LTIKDIGVTEEKCGRRERIRQRSVYHYIIFVVTR